MHGASPLSEPLCFVSFSVEATAARQLPLAIAHWYHHSLYQFISAIAAFTRLASRVTASTPCTRAATATLLQPWMGTRATPHAPALGRRPATGRARLLSRPRCSCRACEWPPRAPPRPSRSTTRRSRGGGCCRGMPDGARLRLARQLADRRLATAHLSEQRLLNNDNAYRCTYLADRWWRRPRVPRVHAARSRRAKRQLLLVPALSCRGDAKRRRPCAPNTTSTLFASPLRCARTGNRFPEKRSARRRGTHGGGH